MSIKKRPPLQNEGDKANPDALADLTREMIKMRDYIDDPEYTNALNKIVGLIEDPDIAINTVAQTIVQLEAMAAKFGVHATYYKTWGKGGNEERYRKDAMYSIREAVQRMADSLKYLVRVREASR